MGRHFLTKAEQADLVRTEVSGARRIPLVESGVAENWRDASALDVDEFVTPSKDRRANVDEVERLRSEIERIHQEYGVKIDALERERNALVRAVSQLRAELAERRGDPGALASLGEPRRPKSARPIVAPALPTAMPSLPPCLPPVSAPPPSPAGGTPTLSDVHVALGSVAPEALRSVASDLGDDRRSTPRFFGEFELEFNYETHFFAGLTLDISTGGLFIATYQLLPVGTRLSLSFQLPDGTRLSVRGEVRWVRSGGEGHERPGMGVAFRELPAEARDKIAAYCLKRPPLYVEL